MLLFNIIFIVYLSAINFYAFILLKSQKSDSEKESKEPPIRDSKLFITGLLGGAIGIYVSMFIFKYRLRSLFLMIIMPILITLNVYVVILAFRTGFSFYAI